MRVLRHVVCDDEPLVCDASGQKAAPMIRKPAAIGNQHMDHRVTLSGVLIGILQRHNGTADITIRLNAGDDIEIHKEKS